METQIATQNQCDIHYNNWLMGVVSAVCRMTRLSQSLAHQLINKCQYIATVPELHQQLENFGIARTSQSAQEFINYWLYADGDKE